jgi:hypothetical protein
MIATESASLRRTIAGLTALALAGCASQPQFLSLQRLPAGQTIELVVAVPSIAPAKVDGDGEALGKGAAQGAGGGAAMGAAAALPYSIVCGPLILVCAPALALMGAGGGAIVGVIGGTVGGAIRGLPPEKAARLETIIGTTVGALDVEQTLRSEFQLNNQQNWHVLKQPTTPQITVGVEAIYIDQLRKNELTLQTVTSLVVRYGPEDRAVTKKILFKVASEPDHIDHWIAGEGANLKHAVTAGLAESMRQIVVVLRR